MIQLKYDSPFRIGLTVLFSMPSAPGGKWGGLAGIQKLIGAKAIERLETKEAKCIVKSTKSFLSNNGIVVTFQKNAWNALKSDTDPLYSIDKARAGKLIGTFMDSLGIPIYGIPPTRLSGLCTRVLRDMLYQKYMNYSHIKGLIAAVISISFPTRFRDKPNMPKTMAIVS